MDTSARLSSQNGDKARLIVVGAGAAGVFAALRAASLNRNLHVQILEAAPRCLGKVKVSGGGRCNVTHDCQDLDRLVAAYPRGGNLLRKILERFGLGQTVDWFQSRGVALKTEPDGRMFPVSDNSQTIIDCLLAEADTLGIDVLEQTSVTGVFHDGPTFRLETNRGPHQADRVLLAPGGSRRSHPWLSRLGHRLVPPVPSLFTFQVDEPALHALAGVSVPHVKARLEAGEDVVEQGGDLLFTHWGLSGPAILRTSAWGARCLHATDYRGLLSLDLCTALSTADVSARMLECRTSGRRREIGHEPPVPIPRRVWRWLVERSGMPPDRFWAGMSNQAITALAAAVKSCQVQVAGKGVFKEEFVTAGGVPLDEVEVSTMESRRVPVFFLAGEILDVDGITGGFNFQSAWATGWVAGTAMAEGIGG